MTVSNLLAGLVVNCEADETMVDNVWSLAERSGDVELLTAMLDSTPRITDTVRASAVRRKEAEIRIAYLGRNDTPTAERAKLLEAERRSEVFAGLLLVAKKNADLGTRLAEQLALKPTKVLARVVLREGFDVADSTWIALRTVSSDKKMPGPLESKVIRAAARFSTKPERCAEMVGFLPDSVIITLDPANVPADSRPDYIARLLTIATTKADRWDWDVRNRAMQAAGKIQALAQIENLDQTTLLALGEASKDENLETAEPIAALLAGRLALIETGTGEHRLQALNASNDDLERLIDFVLVGTSTHSDEIVQGILENPSAWANPRFDDVARAARPTVIVKAMAASRSDELLGRIWPLRHNEMPEECWNFVSDRAAIIARMVADEVALNESPESFRWGGHRLLDLLNLGVSKEVVASLPYQLLESGRSYYDRRWTVSRVAAAVSTQLLELQREYLGTDPQTWENFNNLSVSWNGTLGELLEASGTL